ncbi:MAG: ATPase, T2SS/T4P/T4SS family [Actinomycetota bacterium]
MSKVNRIGQVLVEAGVITEGVLEAALRQQTIASESTGRRPRLGSVLVGMGVVTEEDIARALSTQLNVPYVDLALLESNPELIALVPRRLCERHCFVPVTRTEDGVQLVMADPADIVAIDDARAAHIGRVGIAVAPATAIRETITRFYSSDVDAIQLLKRLGAATEASVEPEVHTESENSEDAERAARGGPVVRLVNAILADALAARATDVHVEPLRDGVKVRYRIDGLLRDVMTLPKSVHLSLVSRLKISSGMDISERRRPQDGRGRLSVDGHDVSLRLSTIPTLQGEKVAIRLLRQDDQISTMNALGFEDDDLQSVLSAMESPQGFLLFTGPTGSGKTTTMYAALSHISDPSKNIVSLEDPIEYHLAGVNQMQIDERTGITFAKGLRSMLRQDPNVIMVGEIRDAETASIALQSAMTGHLVLSTVHTNDAGSAVSRLVDLGVEPFLISGALSIIVAQRLVRIVCPHCKQRAAVNPETLARLGIGVEALGDAALYRGAGCPACSFTGYLGRTAVFQVLTLTRQMRDLIANGPSEGALDELARAAGGRTLLEAGLRKVRAGVTTLEEVLRAIQTDEPDRRPTCPACRHEIEPTFSVCPHCQHALTAPRCPACSKDVDPAWTFCAYCRVQLNRWVTGETKPRILIADDDPHVRDVISTMLADSYEVLVASGGEEALRHAVLYRPDAILLDLHMPDLDGIELAKQLRSSAATSVIPLIMITGDQTGEVEGLRAGVDDYIMKPFDEPRLLARIERVMARR